MENSQKVKVFATADTHFYHKNIIKYCDRPFESVEDMNWDIIRRWNEAVDSNDIVWFLGDFAFAGKTKQLELFSQLQGEIRIIPGNHDYLVKKLGKRGELPSNVKLYPELHKTKIDDRWFVLCHYPLDQWEGMAEHPSDSISDAVHLFGHIHGKPIRGWPNIERFDVGIDVYGRPVQITKQLEYLTGWKGWY